MDVEIREILREDCPAVAALWREELDVAAATDESVKRTYKKMNGDNRYCTYVAAVDGKIVGFITLVEVLSFDDPEGYLKLNGIAVLPEYRRRGIGTQLILRAEQAARERGVSSVGFASTFRREKNYPLYESLGYRKSAYWFCKDLK